MKPKHPICYKRVASWSIDKNEKILKIQIYKPKNSVRDRKVNYTIQRSSENA